MPYPGFQAFSPYSLKTPTPASLPGPSQAVSTPGRPSFPTQPGTRCLLTGTRSKPATSEQGGWVPFPHPWPLNTHWLCWKHCLQQPECHPNPSLHGLQGWRDHTQQDMHPPHTLGPHPSQASHRHTAPLCASQGNPVTSALDTDNAAKDMVPLTLHLLRLHHLLSAVRHQQSRKEAGALSTIPPLGSITSERNVKCK